MQDHSGSAMIALLPVTTDWCKIDLPHMTVVHAGEISELSPGDYSDLGKDVLDISREFAPVCLDVIGIDVFGDEDPVDVLVLEKTQEIISMRSKVERWNASEHDFNPHVTVGPVGSLDGRVPNKILFDRVHLGWGNRGMNAYLNPADVKTETAVGSPSY